MPRPAHVAVILAMASFGISNIALAQDIDISTSQVIEATKIHPHYSNHWVAFSFDDPQNSLTVADEAILTIDATSNDPSQGHTRDTGFYVNSNASLDMSGHIVINAGTETEGFSATGIETNGAIQGTGRLDINVQTANAQTIGLQINNKANVDFSDIDVSIKAESAHGRIFGIAIENKSQATFGNLDVDLKLTGEINGPNQGEFLQGLLMINSEATFKEDANFNVIASNATNADIRILNLEGSSYSQIAHFKKDLSISVDSDGKNVTGILSSGDSNSSSQQHSYVNIDGNLNIKIKGTSQQVKGINTQGYSEVSILEDANLSISSENDNSILYGFIVGGIPLGDDNKKGSISVGDNLNIVMSGKAFQATGILTKTPSDESSYSTLNVGGFANIDLSNIEGDTVAVHAQKSSLITFAEGGRLVADTALQSEEDSIIKVGNEKTNSRLDLIGTVDNNGLLQTKNLTISANGDANYGNVQAENSVFLGKGNINITFTTESAGNNVLLLASPDGHFDVINQTTSSTLTYGATAEVMDQISSMSDVQKLIDTKFSVDGQAGEFFVGAEGQVIGSVTAALDDEGNIIAGTYHEETNKTNQQILDAIHAPLLMWRAETNNLYKRIGDLRTDPNQTGTWLRYNGSKSSIGNTTLKYNSIQLGVDQLINAQRNIRIGAAFTYADANSETNYGSNDGDLYSFALYGSWLSESGSFIDIIGRLGFISSDISINDVTGSLDNKAFSISAETGHRFTVSNLAYLEPSIEFSYGHITGDNFKNQDAFYDLDSYDSFIGRARMSIGLMCPNNRGNIYAKVALAHEFLGESNLSVSNSIIRRTVSSELDDTWMEYGLGASITLSNNTRAYFDFERSASAEIDEDWKISASIRYSW